MSVSSLTTKELKARKRAKTLAYIGRYWQLYLMLIVPIVLTGIFHYGAMPGILIAFKNFNILKGIWDSPWIGFEVFEKIFTNKEFYRVLKNTIVLNLLSLFLSFPAPVLLAVLLNEIRNAAYKRICQTVLYLPHFLSWVIIAAIFYALLSPATGMVNVLIMRWGGESIPFLTESTHWVFTYVFIGVWQGMGWGTIIYLAAISGIDQELYEAAVVDGANRWQKIWHITLPSIRGTIVILLIMQMGSMMGSSLEKSNSLGNTMVTDVCDVIATYVYRVSTSNMQYNVGTAVGLFQSLVGLILVTTTDRIAKMMGESGLF